MEIRVVGIVAPGAMGHAVGRVLREAGWHVITCLQGRSPRTASLAARAGIVDVADDLELVRQADVLLSIVPPAQAMALAHRIAEAVPAAETRLLYADCNAISPQTACAIGDILADAGISYVDGSIIGGPPASHGPPTRLYLSGPEASWLLQLQTPALRLRLLGASIGQASGLKMCYAALTKGLTALATEALVTGHVLGLASALRTELQESQTALLPWIERAIPAMPPKAGRWVGEMEEIAATFDAVGLPPELMAGAAALYRLVSETPLGGETPEERHLGQTVDAVAELLAASLTPPST